MNIDLPLNEIKEIRFSNRKMSISPELRPMYRISQIALILHISSTGEKASLLKLQLFNWCIQKEERYEEMFKLKNDDFFPVISFDPFLNRALNYGVALKIFDFNTKTGKFILTEDGRELAENIVKENILMEEIKFLKSIKKSLSDTYIHKLFKERYSS